MNYTKIVLHTKSEVIHAIEGDVGTITNKHRLIESKQNPFPKFLCHLIIYRRCKFALGLSFIRTNHSLPIKCDNVKSCQAAPTPFCHNN